MIASVGLGLQSERLAIDIQLTLYIPFKSESTPSPRPGGGRGSRHAERRAPRSLLPGKRERGGPRGGSQRAQRWGGSAFCLDPFVDRIGIGFSEARLAKLYN